MGKNLLRILFAIVMSGTLSLSLRAGEIRIKDGQTQVRPVDNTYQQFSFRSDISDLQFRDVNTRLGDFTELFVTGYGYSGETGSPKLPVYHRLIEVPLDAAFEVVITKQEYQDYDLAASGISHMIIPAQAPVSKAILDPDQIPFVMNSEVYQKNEFLGGPLVTVSPVGTLRALRLARIDVAPVQYNPAVGKLRIYSSLEIAIRFVNGNEAATRQVKKDLASPYYEKTYSLLGNYKYEPDQLITSSTVTYVIVSDPMFQQALQPLVHWKTRKGFKVIEAYTNDPAVGNTTTSIKAYLQNLYNNPAAGYTAPSFVLFVGDVPQIPAWMNNGQATDLRYCEYTGDNLPECYYGRFSANNVTQLQPMIDKTMEYEQYQIPDDSYLDSCTMVAGADASHQLTWGNGQINYGTTYYFNTAHNLLSHTYLQPEPSGANYSLQIRTNVSNGVCYANYTAHGGVDGWSDPAFKISHIPALQNLHKYPLMVGNCCVTSTYNQNCFGEELLRAEGKGALGYIGCSNNSYWDEDFWWGCGFKAISANPTYNPQHLGAYDVTFHDQGIPIDDWYVTQGQMVVGGNMAVEESNSSMKTYYWEIYCLMGDPSISIYFSAPPALTATYPSVVIIGTDVINVTTEPYAYIGLSKDDTTYVASACADSLGVATLTFPTLTLPGILDIVITKQNRKPIIDTIQILPGNAPYLIMPTFAVNDSVYGNNDHNADYNENVALDVTIENLGVVAAYNVIASISTTDTNIVITDNQFIFDTVPANATLTAEDAFALTVKNNVEDQHLVNCTVTFDDGIDTWTSALILPLHAPLLSVGSVTVLDPAPGGNNNGILDPGENATLRVTTTNFGHAPVSNGTAHLVVSPASAPYIIVTTPDYFIGDLPVNNMQFAYFNVITNGITPNGTTVNLAYNETAGLQNQYSAVKDFALVLGDLEQYVMTNGSVTTCSGQFLDSGGPNGNYPDNENKTMTFYPSDPTAHIKATFTAFEIEPSTGCTYDYMKIYNGNGVVSPIIGTYCGTNSPGTLEGTSTTGALTFQFHSDYTDNFPGWVATIQCVGGPLTLIANAFPANVCEGGSSQLTALPGGGSGTYTYLWQPSTYLDDPTSATPICTPLANITYTVTVNDGTNNIVSSPIDVTVVPVPQSATIVLNGTTLESSEADGNQWYINGALIPGANGQTYTPVNSGLYYTVIVDQVTGCYSEPSNAINFAITGIGTEDVRNGIAIWPNPFNDRLTVTCNLTEPGFVRITLIDSYGKVVSTIADQAHAPEGTFTATFRAGSLQPGMYYCRISTGNYTKVEKVVLTR